MSHRDALIAAAESLLWERGYESMSPKAVLKRSGAGQGSMYHHFSGKEDLALVAMENHERILWETTMSALREPGLEGVKNWLTTERDPLSGCRLGRLANELAVRTNQSLRAPLNRYFRRLEELLVQRLREAHLRAELSRNLDPEGLACALIAVVQGGYILALAEQDPSCMTRATAAAWELVAAAARERQ